eukprot:scaffold30306_cov22-Tisochrysis_lutea.AAC.2
MLCPCVLVSVSCGAPMASAGAQNGARDWATVPTIYCVRAQNGARDCVTVRGSAQQYPPFTVSV